MDIVLASGSPRRKDILEKMSYSVQVLKPDAEESHFDLYPPYTPILNAIIKAECVAYRHPKKIVIAADTVIEFKNKILGKPSNMKEAENMLQKFSGHQHEVMTSVCIIYHARKLKTIFNETSKVVFKSLTQSQIQAYFSKVNPLDKAGAYGIQAHGDMIIDHFTGEIENIMGLPKTRVHQALQNISRL